MRTISLADAKARLSDLVNRAARGERRKIELASLRAISAATPRQDEDSAALLRRMRNGARY